MICAICSLDTSIAAKDGLCGKCRLASFRVVRYPWTPEKDAQLTRLWRGAKNKTELTARITEMCRRLRYPRYILWNRAATLGLRRMKMQAWAREEIAKLREWSGTLSIDVMATSLGRTRHSVKQKLFMLNLGGKVTEGYSMRELADLMGVHHNKIALWFGRGWLQMDEAEERITHESVERFVWERMEEYRFAACEEWWLKTMLKPSIGRSGQGVGTRRNKAA